MGRFNWLEFPDAAKDDPRYVPPADAGFDDTYYFQKADNSWKLGDFETALRFYAKALGINPQLEEAWFGQVVILMDLGEFKEARVWADKGLEKFPKSRSLLSAKAMVLAKTLELKEAMELSDEAVKKKTEGPYGAKSDWFIWLARGYVLLALGGGYSGGAEYCLSKSLETNLFSWFINLRIAMAYLDNGKARKALPYALKALAGEIQSPLTYYVLGQIYAELGLYAQAKSYFGMLMDGKSELKNSAWLKMQDLNRVPLFKWFRNLFQTLFPK